eukprot:717851-Rhodomonas_salina.1
MTTPLLFFLEIDGSASRSRSAVVGLLLDLLPVPLLLIGGKLASSPAVFFVEKLITASSYLGIPVRVNCLTIAFLNSLGKADPTQMRFAN